MSAATEGFSAMISDFDIGVRSEERQIVPKEKRPGQEDIGSPGTTARARARTRGAGLRCIGQARRRGVEGSVVLLVVGMKALEPPPSTETTQATRCQRPPGMAATMRSSSRPVSAAAMVAADKPVLLA